MIGTFFMMSASNFGHAAIRDATRSFSLNDPVTIRLAAHGPSAEESAYIEVRSPSGFARDVHIDPERMQACRQVEGYEASRAACQKFVDELAAKARAALVEAQAHELR